MCVKERERARDGREGEKEKEKEEEGEQIFHTSKNLSENIWNS